MTISFSGTNGVTFPDNSAQATAASDFDFKNRIINGAMVIAQRATYSASLAAGSTQYGGPDRWYISILSGTTTVSLSQQSTSITLTPYVLRAQRASGQTNTGAIVIAQQIESYNLYGLQGSTVTMSFQARAGANFSASGNTLTAAAAFGTGTDQASIGGVNGTWTGWSVTSQAFTLTTSLQTFSWSFSVPSGCNEMSVSLQYTPTGTAGASDYFEITNVQVEKGATATAFAPRPFGQELLLCQRYYQNGGSVFCGNTEGTTSYAFQVQFVQPMRSSPAANTRSGYYFNARYGAADVLILNPTTTIYNTTPTGAWAVVTSSGLTTNYPIVGRQQNTGQTDFLSFSAEL